MSPILGDIAWYMYPILGEFTLIIDSFVSNSFVSCWLHLRSLVFEENNVTEQRPEWRFHFVHPFVPQRNFFFFIEKNAMLFNSFVLQSKIPQRHVQYVVWHRLEVCTSRRWCWNIASRYGTPNSNNGSLKSTSDVYMIHRHSFLFSLNHSCALSHSYLNMCRID